MALDCGKKFEESYSRVDCVKDQGPLLLVQNVGRFLFSRDRVAMADPLSFLDAIVIRRRHKKPLKVEICCEAKPSTSFSQATIRFASVSLSSISDPSTASVPEPNNAPRRRVKSRKSWRLPFFEDADSKTADAALSHVWAGTMARTLSQFLGHPLDTIKTRVQVKDPPKKLKKWVKKVSKKSISLGNVEVMNWFFKGPADIYRGVTAAIIGTALNASLYFIAYESSKRKLEKANVPPWITHMTSAAVGTISASLFRVPSDTLKHRVQAYMHDNVFDAFRVMVSERGILGLYKGFWPTLMRDIPEIGMQFLVYEQLRQWVQRVRGEEKLKTLEHLALGAAAGAVAATVSMPLDLVKTRQQCGAGAESIGTILVSVWRENGPAGLFAGLKPRAVHVSVMSAIFFVAFECCKLMLKPDRSAHDKDVGQKIWNKRRDKIWKRQFVYTE